MKRCGILPLLLALALALEAQESTRMQVNVRLVNVAFTVRDGSGDPVANLVRDDFEVFDDGEPQTVSYFARSADLPLTLGLIVDMSDSQEHFVKPHERDLEAFLNDVVRERDRAFLICFGNHLRLVSDFSASSAPLMDGLRRFEKGERKFPEIGPPDHRELGTAFYDSLYYSTTEKLAAAEGARKALIVFSDGEDNSSAHHMLDAIEAAQRENVVVYAIRYTQRRGGRLTARNKYGIGVMSRLTKETGGRDFDAQKDDMRKSFREIGQELRSSYELAYHATNSSGDGTFHKLRIRPKREGLTVHAKTGYFAQ